MNSNYHRVRITGCLTTGSALHIGSGEDKPFDDTENNTEIGHYNAVCLDSENKPYLPGSSLRGFLANTARDLKIKVELQEALFGIVNSKDQGRAGKLRIYDGLFRHKTTFSHSSTSQPVELKQKAAKAQFEKFGTFFQTSTSIDPILGVADEHHLFNIEIVPAGSCFSIEILLEQPNHEQLAHTLALLAYWDGSTLSAIGGGSGKGRGRVTWKLEKVEVIDDEILRTWLTAETNDISLNYRVLETQEYPTVELQRAIGKQISFTLIPHHTFLLNDPAYVDDTRKDKDEENIENNEPDLVYSRRPTGHAYIPATALRGWVRGRMRRILLSLFMQQSLEFEQAKKSTDSLVNQLFGTTEQRGKLWFDDAVSEQIPEPFPQTFNAVDRFTGGVAKTALFNVEAARCSCLKGNIWVQKELDAWEKGILLLIGRDLLEDELMLGWGKSRGYGGFSVQFGYDGKNIKNSQELRNSVETTTESWLKELNAQLNIT